MTMELSRWDTAENVITIRISEAEYEALEKWVEELNWSTNTLKNKVTISKLARKMIRFCLNRKNTLRNILYE